MTLDGASKLLADALVNAMRMAADGGEMVDALADRLRNIVRQFGLAVAAERGRGLDELMLAARAPEPPAWFVPRMETPRPAAITERDGRDEIVVVNEDRIEAWDRERTIQRLAQWPWEYARLVMAARPEH